MRYNFLQEVKRIHTFYEKQKALSGENFNIFSIMSMESDEVFTHSSLICELLNLNGSHGLKEKPLELFVQNIIGDGFDIDFEQTISLKEEHIGKTNTEKSEGGRLDIIVKEKYVENNSDKIFVIENKIYATEQENQLYRYKNKYPKAKLLYLTLEGADSKQISIEENTNNSIYTSISYKKDILVWIEDCARLAYDKPMLREVLNQYTFLIKKLTNQTTNKEMETEVQHIIIDNLEASKEIYNNYEKTIEHLQNQLIEELKIKISDSLKNWNIKIINYEKDNRLSLDLTSKNGVIRINFRFKNSNLLSVINVFGFPEKSFTNLHNLGFKKMDKEDKNSHAWMEYKNISLQDLKHKNILNIEEKIKVILELL